MHLHGYLLAQQAGQGLGVADGPQEGLALGEARARIARPPSPAPVLAQRPQHPPLRPAVARLPRRGKGALEEPHSTVVSPLGREPAEVVQQLHLDAAVSQIPLHTQRGLELGARFVDISPGQVDLAEVEEHQALHGPLAHPLREGQRLAVGLLGLVDLSLPDEQNPQVGEQPRLVEPGAGRSGDGQRRLVVRQCLVGEPLGQPVHAQVALRHGFLALVTQLAGQRQGLLQVGQRLVVPPLPVQTHVHTTQCVGLPVAVCGRAVSLEGFLEGHRGVAEPPAGGMQLPQLPLSFRLDPARSLPLGQPEGFVEVALRDIGLAAPQAHRARNEQHVRSLLPRQPLHAEHRLGERSPRREGPLQVEVPPGRSAGRHRGGAAPLGDGSAGRHDQVVELQHVPSPLGDAIGPA